MMVEAVAYFYAISRIQWASVIHC